MRTVFFGPFIGEFGWELARWQGWVRKVCLEEFRDWRKIACSLPGRRAFYPYADEFWTVPESFLQTEVTPWGYITAGWRNGWPGRYTERRARIRVPEHRAGGWAPPRLVAKVIRKLFPPSRVTEARLKAADVEPRALAMFAEIEQRLPRDTLFFVPWRMNEYQPTGLKFGVEIAHQPTGLSDFVTHEIPASEQQLEFLQPSSAAVEEFGRLFPLKKRLIGVFPRHIVLRRSDRNWPKSRYLRLISRLQEEYPDMRVAVFGEPGGAYFADGSPPGCLNLIDVPEELRLDVQLAALRRCVLAVGGASGGLSMAMAAGCPVMWWGYDYAADMVHRCNPLGTPMLFYPSMQPSVDEVLRLVRSVYWMIQHGSWKVAR